MKPLFDHVNALVQQSFNTSTLKELLERYSSPDERQLQEPMYMGYCKLQASEALALQALGAPNSDIVTNIRGATVCFLPYFRSEIKKAASWDMRKSHDIRGIADYHFAELFALYVATHAASEIVHVCNETYYGRYMGSPGLNSVEGVYCRIVRALYTDNREWLDEELQELKARSREQDPVHPCFGISPALLHELFSSMFTNDKAMFAETAKKAAKWYSQRVHKGHSTAEGLKYYTSINGLLLSLVKMVVSTQGMELEMEDAFLPLDVVCWE